MIKVKPLKRKNPKDEEFLELVKVIRKNQPLFYRYEVYFRNELIGFFDIGKEDNYIQLMNIPDHKYKRRGLATFMHDYIEQDLGIKIRTSDFLSKQGKKFYEAREKLTKKNPTDLSLLRMIKIVRKEIELGVWNRKRRSEEILIVYKIYFRDNQIGYVEIIKGTNFIEDVVINEEFRRKGLANYLYNYIEKDLKIKLRPSSVQLDDGKAFWKARLK